MSETLNGDTTDVAAISPRLLAFEWRRQPCNWRQNTSLALLGCLRGFLQCAGEREAHPPAMASACYGLGVYAGWNQGMLTLVLLSACASLARPIEQIVTRSLFAWIGGIARFWTADKQRTAYMYLVPIQKSR